jgi:hypothetical protein
MKILKISSVGDQDILPCPKCFAWCFDPDTGNCSLCGYHYPPPG